MYRGDISTEPAPVAAFNVASLCGRLAVETAIPGLFGRMLSRIVRGPLTATPQAHRALLMLTGMNFNVTLFVERPDMWDAVSKLCETLPVQPHMVPMFKNPHTKEEYTTYSNLYNVVCILWTGTDDPSHIQNENLMHCKDEANWGWLLDTLNRYYKN